MAHDSNLGLDALIRVSDLDYELPVTGKDDDTVIFVAAEHHESGPQGTFYNAGKGDDTLVIVLTADEWADPDTKLEVLAFYAILEEASQGGYGSKYFSFETLNLSVKNFESFILIVDGEEIDPRGVTSIDLSSSAADETIEVPIDVDTDIRTGSGSDTIILGDGDHVVDAGDGNNTVTTGSGDDVIIAGSGDDIIRSGDGQDTITIGDGDDYVDAGPGNDLIIAGEGGGDDIIDGGPGIDTVTYPSATNSVTIDLRAQDRSTTSTVNNGTVGDYLASAGHASDLPVGLATGTEIDVDILISIENATGGSGDDTIIGNDEVNILDGGSDGADTLNGMGGNDTLRGGAGDDNIDGGDGFDALKLDGAMADYSFSNNYDGTYTVTDNGGSGDGTDTFTSINEIRFSDTTVPLWGLVDFVVVYGTNNDEIIYGTPGQDQIFGLDGNDELYGLESEDILTGGRGNDILDGGSGTSDDANFYIDIVDYSAEFFAGGTQGVVVNLSNGVATDAYGDTDMLVEIERVYGTNFDDVFTGSDGSDGFDPHGGNDQIDGGDGWDGLYYHNAINVGGAGGIIVEFSTTVEGSGTVLIDPFGDTDIFTGIESISGTNSVDYITGGIGFQQISTRAGNDIIDGTIGLQEVSYSNDASRGGFGGIFVDMEILDLQGFASATDGFGDTDLLKDIEQVRGTGTLDTILGDGADNSFEGRAGDDFLSGRAGSDYLNGGADMDTIDGGADNDWLVGGSEADIFEFEAGDGYDTIEDFAVGEDSLFLLGGLTIVSLSEADVGGEVGPDTIVLLSTGEEITLLNVSGVADANDLL